MFTQPTIIRAHLGSSGFIVQISFSNLIVFQTCWFFMYNVHFTMITRKSLINLCCSVSIFYLTYTYVCSSQYTVIYSLVFDRIVDIIYDKPSGNPSHFRSRTTVRRWCWPQSHDSTQSCKCSRCWAGNCSDNSGMILFQRRLWNSMHRNLEIKHTFQQICHTYQSCPRVGWTRGSGRVTILPDFGGSGRVGSALRIF